ncbi:MAG TPA: KaiC domain-containing protein [Caldanaerobacter subterraneus]|uniref:KaiC domain-containing protein n=1 Tax=Caldanaerobacter subterraneus TaxID=911092 RepID=A0A357VPV8_9THEO|nr:KaiC domain-containing protein [Caldanaerobacter subterraneus]HBT50425.1 KaiC domain-containing protein [Caldanaerobacter subterraneus]
MQVILLRDVAAKTPKLFGIPSGIPGLDELFYTAEIEEGEIVRVPLQGLPSASVIHLAGVPDTGKTLMGQQFAITQAARGYNVLFVTVEVPAVFTVQGLKQRCKGLGIEWGKIENSIYLLDLSHQTELKSSVDELTTKLGDIIREKNIKACVIDSITGLYEGQEMVARKLVRRLYEVMKDNYQTAIFISQKRSSHEELSSEAAGGYAVSHILDCNIVLAKIVASRTTASSYGVSPGEVVRTIRIDGCRMCGHDTRVHILHIDDLGIVKVGKALSEK